MKRSYIDSILASVIDSIDWDAVDLARRNRSWAGDFSRAQKYRGKTQEEIGSLSTNALHGGARRALWRAAMNLRATDSSQESEH
jgi:hypothetical protein